MSYDIITDPQKELSVLVDAELGRALGPVASGPNAEQVLEAFVGALGVDPAMLQHWEISFRWSQYLDALIGDVEHEHTPPADDEPDPTPAGGQTPATGDAVPDTAGAPSGSAPAGAKTVVPTEPVAAPSSASATTSDHARTADEAAAEAIAAAAAAEPPAPGPADTDPTVSGPSSGAPAAGPDDAPSSADAVPDAVRPTVPAGEVTCPQCDGWATIAEHGQVVDCPLCGATGAVTQGVADGYAQGQATA